MSEHWVCGDCRSMNNARDKRCYRCRVPRATGEMTEATTGMALAAAQRQQTVLARAARVGARYRRSWPVALLLVPLILLATLFHFELVRVVVSMLDADGLLVLDRSRTDEMARIVVATWAAYGAALVVWGIWLALVVSNVPALVAQWPKHGPIGAFFAPLIPFLNLKRPHTIVGHTMAHLSGNQIAPGVVATFWWIAVLGSYLGPTVVVVGRALSGAHDTDLEAGVLAMQIRLIFLVPAAILAIGVVAILESLQRAALRRRATTVLTAEGDPA
jgi:hypothetical protein